jgi:hypothetical protein
MKPTTTQTPEPTVAQRQFTQAIKAGDLATQVEMASRQAQIRMTLALEEPVGSEWLTTLAGEVDRTRPSIGWDCYVKHVSAAYAMGMAVGQLVAPAVPSRAARGPRRATKGGRR